MSEKRSVSFRFNLEDPREYRLYEKLNNSNGYPSQAAIIKDALELYFNNTSLDNALERFSTQQEVILADFKNTIQEELYNQMGRLIAAILNNVTSSNAMTSTPDINYSDELPEKSNEVPEGVFNFLA